MCHNLTQFFSLRKEVSMHSSIRDVVESLLVTRNILGIDRVAEGGSTIVYRVATPYQQYYLRVHPEVGGDFAAEAAVHQVLSGLGVKVPLVVLYAKHHPVIQRSLLLTTAIPGRAIGSTQPQDNVIAVVQAAGRELARIHQVSVAHYGWITQTQAEPLRLRAEYAQLAEWLHAHFTLPLEVFASHFLPASEGTALLQLLKTACQLLNGEPAVVAHGDFDVTHIYFEREQFTGIIDFGEIRGTHWLYDLAHFAIENHQLLPYLLQGYQTVRPVNGDDEQLLELTALLIAAPRAGRRVIQQRSVHPPDLDYIQRLLPRLKNKFG